MSQRARRRVRRRRAEPAAPASEPLSVLDLVDNLLSRGVVLTGEVTLALADVDLVYLRISVLLAGAHRLLADARDSARNRRRPGRAAARRVA